jgi:hypothetical protein
MNKLLSILVLVFLSFLSWHSARSGYAARLIPQVLSVNDVAVVAKAVRLTPNDPHAQVVLGALLEANEDRAAALEHYETAVALRPEDYVLRMQLARAQELAGDSAAAIATGTVAAKLAPFYAQPHWQLGNILVRAGRADEGFNELRLAGTSDPNLLPSIIDLAWQLSGGNVDYVLQAIQPRTPDAHKALAAYFLKQGKAEAATKMFAAAGGSPTEPERRAYIAQLISLKKFPEAHSLWMMAHQAAPNGPLLFDGGFEAETDLDEPGFGWRALNKPQGFALSLDNSNPTEGRSSLRVDFTGESNAGVPVISQLVLLKPQTHYQLHVSLRTEKLVSGGLPIIVVADPSDNKVLGQTEPLPQTTEGWQTVGIDFTTGESTSAIQIALQRQPCPSPQCPIFGKLWLDNFELVNSK